VTHVTVCVYASLFYSVSEEHTNNGEISEFLACLRLSFCTTASHSYYVCILCVIGGEKTKEIDW
jgi:hypothetical protein